MSELDQISVRTPSDVFSIVSEADNRYPRRNRIETEKGEAYTLELLLRTFKSKDKSFISRVNTLNLILAGEHESDTLTKKLNQVHDDFTSLRATYKKYLALSELDTLHGHYKQRKTLYVECRQKCKDIIGPFKATRGPSDISLIFEEKSAIFLDSRDHVHSLVSGEPNLEVLQQGLEEMDIAFRDVRACFKSLTLIEQTTSQKRDLYESHKATYFDLRNAGHKLQDNANQLAVGPNDSVSQVGASSSNISEISDFEGVKCQMEARQKQLEISASATKAIAFKQFKVEQLKADINQIKLDAKIEANKIGLEMVERVSSYAPGRNPLSKSFVPMLDIKKEHVGNHPHVQNADASSQTHLYRFSNVSNQSKLGNNRLVYNSQFDYKDDISSIFQPSKKDTQSKGFSLNAPNNLLGEVRNHSPDPMKGTEKNPEINNTLSHILMQQNVMTQQLIETQIRATLPTPRLEKFNGSDPLKFLPFMQSFYRLIECRTTDPYEILFQLVNACTGEAKTLIQNCASYENLDNAQLGLHKAKALLHERYGDPCIQVLAYEKQLENWPQISSGDRIALDSFSIFLTDCSNAMQLQPDLLDLNSTRFIQSLARKLPVALQEKWKVTVSNIKDAKYRLASFVDFQEFVGKLARQQNDPQTLDLGYQLRKTKPNTIGHRHNVMATNVQQEQQNSRKQGNHSASLGQFNRGQNDQSGYSQNFKSQRSHSASNGAFSSNQNSPNANTLKQGNHPASNSNNFNCKFCGEKDHFLVNCKLFEDLESDKKLNFIRKENICFACLKVGHMASNCKKPLVCGICNKKHPTSLHKPDNSNTKVLHNHSVDWQNNPAGNDNGAGDNIKMAIVAVRIRPLGSDNFIETNAFLDNGSSGVLVTEDLKSALNLRGKLQTVSMKTINGSTSVNSYLLSDKLQIVGVDKSNSWDDPVVLRNVYTCEKIPVDVNDKTTQNDIVHWSYLENIEIAEPCTNVLTGVHVMIGISCPQATEPKEVIPSQGLGPYALLTRLGWIVFGVCNKNLELTDFSMNFCKVDDSLDKQLKSYYQRDFNEKLAFEETQYSMEDKKFISIMDNGVSFANNHYILPLPLRNENLFLPNNEVLAQGFLMGLKKKLLKNDDLRDKYTVAMEDMQLKGYSETVPFNELNRNDGLVWYIPHHIVLHPKKPGKVRPVFNCPAVYRDRSLNSELLQGPDLTNLQLGVFMRFRVGHIAMMADIESMFYQVQVEQSHRDLLRFLWWPDGILENPPVVRRMTAHLFGAVSSPSIANYSLRRAALDQKNNFDNHIIESVLKNFYVDDFLKSEDSVDASIEIAKSVTELLKRSGFNLCKWISNSKEVLASIPAESRSKDIIAINIWEENLPTESALGILWEPETDLFRFHLQACDELATKRNVLSVVSKLYDPIGISAPLTLEPKLIVQEACRAKLAWDEPLPPNLKSRWEKWVVAFPQLENFSFCRCFKPVNFETIINVQLHHFSDASDDGYGVVSYLRFVDENDHIHCSFVSGKSRVSPIKPFTIVQKELTACKVAVQQNIMLQKELALTIDESFFWTDSMTVLKYIFNEDTRFKTFVSNRLSIIHSGSELRQWFYVPTKINPADHASRGLPMDKFLNCELWIKGPHFLWTEQSTWPVYDFGKNLDNEDANIKKVKINATKIELSGVCNLLAYYSSWYRLKKGVLYFYLFMDYLKFKKRKLSWSPYVDLSRLQYLKKAEHILLHLAQKECFSSELYNLSHGQTLIKDSKLYSLCPFLGTDNLMKVGGRLKHSSLSPGTKYPTILPGKHKISNLIVQDIHVSSGHVGRNHTISLLRENYWIIGANTMVKSILKTCVVCKKQNGLPNAQLMADLPIDRVIADKAPFTAVGLDYFGPFDVKQGRSFVKRYGVILTCLTSRAVHIEVAHSMDTDAFINVLRRFIARRGQVKRIRSDNGTNFVGACNELKRALNAINKQSILQFCDSKNIEWVFNPPCASHFGGVWERLIKSIRKILQGLLNEQNLKVCKSDDSLNTFMCEVEAIINSRPLTANSDDINDLEALTPNHILLMKADICNAPPGIFVKEDLYVRRRWRQVQFLADMFWKRWNKEYLLTLQTRQKWLKPKRDVKLGDMVLIIDENVPRNQWALGKVLEVFPGDDGHVRHVKIKTKYSVFERPVHKTITILEADAVYKESEEESLF